MTRRRKNAGACSVLWTAATRRKASLPIPPGSYIQGSFRSGNYSRYKGVGRAHAIIGIVSLILVAVILFYIIKFYSLL